MAIAVARCQSPGGGANLGERTSARQFDHLANCLMLNVHAGKRFHLVIRDNL